ncbi:hypothetical protein [Lutibacter sp. B1]|uniref:hypothetical protein n=1 Tax=Lutibacter sp. B1 TaxID=2725996 RepID=UPI0014573B30|nr:hypothetical protein [Lutibacter sp. B1]NLP59349.1 hypothetical protein [Lutibacter sp. B1]
MKKMKNYLIFGILISLISCQQNDEFNINENSFNQNKYISKKITLQEIKQNNNLAPFIKNIKSNDNLSFTILTDEIIQIVTDSTEVYTFRLENPTVPDSDFENFVIEKVNSNDYVYYLYRYKKVDINENNQMSYLFSKQIIDVDNSQIYQEGFKKDYWASIDCWVYLSYDSNGILTIEILECGGGGGGDGGGENDTTGGETDTTGGETDTTGGESWDSTGDDITGGGSSPSTGEGTTSSGSTTSPVGVIPSPTAVMLETFFENLTTKQKECLKSQSGINLHNQIKTFLIDNFDPNTDDTYAQKANVSSRVSGLESNSFTFDDAQNFAKLVLDNCGAEVDYVNKIIDNLTGKADCVYKKLQNNSLLSKTLEKFIGEKTPVHLILNDKSNLRVDDDDPTSSLVNGKTYYGSSFYITITLNTEQSNNRPSLAVVRTILHEAIHAEIFRKIKTNSGILYSNGIWKLPDGSRADYPSLFDAYNEDPKNPYHNYMAKYYREAIISGLKEYAIQIGETHSDQFYEDMAWNGLLDTKEWDRRFADPNYANEEKSRIRNVIYNYEKSNTNECQ